MPRRPSAILITVVPDGRTDGRTETQTQQKNQKVFDLASRLGEVRYRYSTSPEGVRIDLITQRAGRSLEDTMSSHETQKLVLS